MATRFRTLMTMVECTQQIASISQIPPATPVYVSIGTNTFSVYAAANTILYGELTNTEGGVEIRCYRQFRFAPGCIVLALGCLVGGFLLLISLSDLFSGSDNFHGYPFLGILVVAIFFALIYYCVHVARNHDRRLSEYVLQRIQEVCMASVVTQE